MGLQHALAMLGGRFWGGMRPPMRPVGPRAAALERVCHGVPAQASSPLLL